MDDTELERARANESRSVHAAPRPRLTRRGLLTTAGAPITAMTGLGAVDYTTVGTLRQDVIARTATGAPSVGAGRARRSTSWPAPPEQPLATFS